MNSSTPQVVESPTEIGDRMFTEGQSDYYKTTPKEHIISPKVQGLLMRKNSLQHNSTKTINLKMASKPNQSHCNHRSREGEHTTKTLQREHYFPCDIRATSRATGMQNRGDQTINVMYK